MLMSYINIYLLLAQVVPSPVYPGGQGPQGLFPTATELLQADWL